MGEEDADVWIQKWSGPHHPLPAEGPVTRQPWLTPAYRGWGVERVSRTGDRAGTGLSTPACSASLIHTSSEAPQPTYALQPPGRPSMPPRQTTLQAALVKGGSALDKENTEQGGTLETSPISCYR